MKKSSIIKIVVAVVAQCFILFLLIISKLLIFSGGEAFLLKISPVDPRDPLRGDYVTFQYDISQLNSWSLREESDKYRVGQIVYVGLDDIYDPSNTIVGKSAVFNGGINTKKPESGSFIKGIIERIDEFSEDGVPQYSRSFKMHIKYGIEEYFIPEGRGRNVDFSSLENYAKVIIDEDGNSLLESLYFNGIKW